MKPLAIVGLDPGLTTAYTIIDLEGNILSSYSARELALSEVISHLISRCQPLLLATDKFKVPAFVEECGRKLGVIVITPDHDLRKEEKRQIVEQKGYTHAPFDDHQYDALASALYGQRKYRHRLEKIQRFLQAHPLPDRQEEFIRMAVTTDLHFSLIYDLLTQETSENMLFKQAIVDHSAIPSPNLSPVYRKLSSLQEKNRQLEQTISWFQQELAVLRKENTLLGKKTHLTQRRIEALFGFKEDRLKFQESALHRHKSMIAALETEIAALYRFIESVPRYQLVKRLPTLNRKDFLERNELLNIKDNDVLLIDNPLIFSERVVHQLAGRGIILVSRQPLSGPLNERFFHCCIEEQDLLSHTPYFALLDISLLEKRREPQDMVEKVVAEYREGRK